MLIKAGMSKKRIIYTVVFFFFCLIDQRIKTGSGLDGQIETFRALTGVGIAVLILSHYHLKDMREHKIPYLIWSLICVIGGILFIAKGQALRYFWNERATIAVNVLLWGVILIHTCRKVLSAKSTAESNMDRKSFCLWLVMMGIMCVSRSAYHWPALYLIMFICFYLTDFTSAEREELFHGMLDGVIWAFWLMQGWCFAFRPYDDVRYVGVYNNSNLNAVFYLAVLAAAMTKLIYWYSVSKDKGMYKALKLYYTAGVGVTLGFLFLTISRTGWMTAVILVFFGLFFLWKIGSSQNIFKFYLKQGLVFVLCFVLLFPAVFGAVRYLPPMFHHPVWFFGEWSEDKVHSWDKWDSEKFVDIDEFLGTANKRVARIFGNVIKTDQSDGQAQKNAVLTENEKKKEIEPSELQLSLYEETLAAGYAFPAGYKASDWEVRGAIYRYYIHLLNLTGHPESEQGFQMTATHRIGHAHNIYLQWGVDFGVPAMILFIGIVLYTFIRLIKSVILKHSVQDAGYLMFFLIPCVFGMLEYAWGAGTFTLLVLFMTWRRIIRNEDRG